MTKALTRRQQEILDMLAGEVLDFLRLPTIRELGERLGIGSTNGVFDHLCALERKGYLDLSDGYRGRNMLTKKFRDLYGLYFSRTVCPECGYSGERMTDGGAKKEG